MKSIKADELVVKIRSFLDKYASVRPDYDPSIDEPVEKYASPDASMLHAAADLLDEGIKPSRVWSEWGSGGYKPYTSEEGREEHDSILKEIEKIMEGED